MDHRHLTIAEKYIDQLVQPDGIMSREWVLLQLARVAAEGESLAHAKAPKLFLGLSSEPCQNCGGEFIDHGDVPFPCPPGEPRSETPTTEPETPARVSGQS